MSISKFICPVIVVIPLLFTQCKKDSKEYMQCGITDQQSCEKYNKQIVVAYTETFYASIDSLTNQVESRFCADCLEPWMIDSAYFVANEFLDLQCIDVSVPQQYSWFDGLDYLINESTGDRKDYYISISSWLDFNSFANIKRLVLPDCEHIEFNCSNYGDISDRTGEILISIGWDKSNGSCSSFTEVTFSCNLKEANDNVFFDTETIEYPGHFFLEDINPGIYYYIAKIIDECDQSVLNKKSGSLSVGELEPFTFTITL